MADAYSADSWFFIPSDQIDNILSTNITWPFMNISKEQLRQLRTGLIDRNGANIFLHRYATPMSAVGIVLTMLLIGTLWHKAIVKKNSFYISMMIVAVSDLLFLILSVPHKAWYKWYKIYGSDSFIGMYALLYARGLMYSVSLASDMCAVVLTMERYLAIAKPDLHKRLSESYKKSIRTILGLIVFLVAATRLHYCFDKQVKADGLTYFFTTTEFAASSFMGVVTMIGDIILPFVLLFTMAFLSTLFRLSVLKRQKKKTTKAKIYPQASMMNVVSLSRQDVSAAMIIHNHSNSPIGLATVAPMKKAANSWQQNASDSRDMRSIVTLTLALDALFILNQLGFCMYCVAELLLANHPVTYESTYDEFRTWIICNLWEAYSDIACTIAEIFSHALNFSFYMALSGSMRLEFRRFMKGLFKCKC